VEQNTVRGEIQTFRGKSVNNDSHNLIGGNMDDKILNFIIVLVTGRVFNNIARLDSVDLWDCEEGVSFFLDHFLPLYMPKETLKLDKGPHYYNFSIISKMTTYGKQ